MEKTVIYFNSIKVQLELYDTFIFHLLFLFQFHKGTIRTSKSIIDAADASVRFQFHKGTIRTLVLLVLLWVTKTHFNSIKVQLEQSCCRKRKQC